MIDAKGPEHRRISHVIEHNRWHALRSKEGQVDRQTDENRIGNEKAGDKYPLPILTDVQHFGNKAADDIAKKNRRKKAV